MLTLACSKLCANPLILSIKDHYNRLLRRRATYGSVVSFGLRSTSCRSQNAKRSAFHCGAPVSIPDDSIRKSSRGRLEVEVVRLRGIAARGSATDCHDSKVSCRGAVAPRTLCRVASGLCTHRHLGRGRDDQSSPVVDEPRLDPYTGE